jgi:signal peptidase I
LDFALILVVLTAVAGVIWLFDVAFLKRSRLTAAAGGKEVREPIVVEYAKSFFPILLLVLVIRSFLFEPFRIPSGSMMPTLLEGDFIFVNKFAYGLRLPVLNSKVVGIGDPERGDVIVFRLPSDPRVNYIKRVVGLPGDTVAYDQGSRRLTINGKPISYERVGLYEDDPGLTLGREQLGEHDHRILWMNGNPARGGTFEVPAGNYFVMGDNRDNSKDSRYSFDEGVGFVPEGNLVGRAVGIWMNWRWPSQGGPQWSRIGKGIE